MNSSMTSHFNKPALDVVGKRDLELGPFATAPSEPGQWNHWRMRSDEDGVAWLLLDKKDAGTNTLNEEVLTELDAALAMVSQLRPTGLVIRSAKPGGFIAGADIGGFRGVTDVAKVEAEIARGHAVLDRLDALPVPTVAVIHGYCLGGGLEVALACDHRIAIDNASFGFPEVLLGLHPGLGGTVRTPRLINPVQAMTMMLTGRTARAAGEIARPRRCGDAGTPRARRRQRRGQRQAEDVAARTTRPAPQRLAGAQLPVRPH